jgi:hypothetical protein
MRVEKLVKKPLAYAYPGGWGAVLSYEPPHFADIGIFLILTGDPYSSTELRRGDEERYFYEKSDQLLSNNYTNPAGLAKELASAFSQRYRIRGERVEILVSVMKGWNIYVVSRGLYYLSLFRGGREIKIIDGVKEGEVVFSEGTLAEGDCLLFFSANLLQKLNRETLKYEILGNRFDVLDKVSYCTYLLLKPQKVTEKTEYDLQWTRGATSSYLPPRAEGVINIRVGRQKPLERLVGFVSSVARKISGRVPSYDYEIVARRKKKLALVGLLFLFLLSFGILAGIKAKKDRDYRVAFEEDLILAEHDLEQSIQIHSLNKTRSRELFVSAENITKSLVEKGIKDSELENLAIRIEENRGKILGEYRSTPENFVDLSLVTDGFNGDSLSYSDGHIFVIDRTSRKVIDVEASSKRADVLIGPTRIDQIYSTAYYDGKVFVFNSDGIFEVASGKKKVSEAKFSENILTAAFAGNLYLLDKDSSKILRLLGNDNTFGEPRDWLSPSVSVGLGNARKMLIDGSVWVLADGGKIYKFSQGNQVGFRFEEGFGDSVVADSIFTSLDSTWLYVLDRSQAKIFVFSKSGDYVAQYAWDGLKDVTDIVVSESNANLVLLTGHRLLSISLKHL